MKYFIYVMNVLLVIAIPITFIVTPNNCDKHSNDKKFKTSLDDKFLKSEVLTLVIDTEEEKDVEKEKETVVAVNSTKNKTITDNVIVKKEEPVVQENVVTDVLETQTGKMSGYGPDCRGCSGTLASGKYVGDGTIYYQDAKYGSVRILAGDRTYKFGTIVRVKNSRVGDFIGIVLDRGGSIGIGKTFLFDLLYASEKEALIDEVSYNVVFEILRYGY